MTAPQFDPSAEQDALTHISQMMVGTKVLQNEPGLVYTLAQQKAHPADAQTIDQFLQSLQAEKRVALARATASTGSKIILSDAEKAMLDANGVPYKDVEFTQQDHAKAAADRVMTATNGQYTAKTNADGTLALDGAGNIQTIAVHKQVEHSGGGFWSGVGGFFGGGWDAIKSGVGGALEGMTKAYNFVQAGLHSPVSGPNLNDVLHGNLEASHIDSTSLEDQKAAGYGTDLLGTLAFMSSGKKHTDLSDLIGTYGRQQVDETLRFLNDPNKYRSDIENDPANWTRTTDGQPDLVPEAKAKLNYLASKDFEHLARRLNAHNATVGNDIANALRIDPIHDAGLYKTTAAVSNIVASFVIDPTLMGFRLAQEAKLARVGIDGLGDTKAADILTRNAIPGTYTANVQRGWQRAINLGEQFRQAGGDVAKQAAVTAKFRATLPALEPLWENFTGGERVFQGYHQTETELVNGELRPKALFGQSDGIRNLDQAASFIADKWGLVRLTNGRAATQSGLMPGALSAVGYRKLKGLTAGWMTTRSADRAIKAAGAIVSRAEADPALAKRLLDDKSIREFMPESDDAVLFHDGTILSDARYTVTPKGLGEAKQNLRATGDILGDSTLGRFSPVALAERARQAGIRFSTLLPRNTVLDINDARSGDILYKTAMTYLNRGEANTYRAMWNVADGGQRKVLVHGLIDQLGHAAGLGKTQTGQELLARLKTEQEAYFASGDGITLNGEHVAGFEGQTRSSWVLPSFLEMQKAANRIGVYEATMGRALNSNQADMIMSMWKFGALFKPSTVTRNVLEGGLRTILDGRAGNAMRARAVATMKNKELWARGKALDSTARHDYEAAVAAGDTAKAKQIENSNMLSGNILGRSRPTDWVANTPVLAATGRAYRALVGRHMDEETLDALLTYGHEDLSLAMEGYGLQLMEYELGWRSAAKQASETADVGYGPAHMTFKQARERSKAEGTPVGTQWTHQATDGSTGADRYANNLGQRVNAMPQTAKAAIAMLKLGDAPGRGKALEDVVQALEAESKNTAFGRVYFPDIVNNPGVARKAATPEEVAAGKLDWADKVVNEYRYLLTGQNGKLQHELADYINKHGEAPSGDWIAGHLTNDNRPEAALYPSVMAMVPGGPTKLAQILQDTEGAAYQFFVERPLQRLMSSPVFLANYATSRKALNPMLEKMVAGGMDREAAENLAKDLATRQSWVKTEQLIDDPGQKTQFDIVARNLFPFSRATQAMIRRWGTGLWQNPAAARKMMLAYEGAVHSGLIYNNAYGEPTFTYPGSGAMNMALRGLAQVPGFENFGRFPVAGDMTGQVLMSVPGADNPFRMGMGPMISVPFREIYSTLLPYMHAHLGVPTASAQEALTKVDEIVNGPIGQGETWTQFVPTAVRKFYVALSGDQRNSALASSMNGAIANLAAAGLLPAPDASSSDKQAFLHSLQTQVKSQLFLRAVFGLFSPAAPSTPSDATSGSGADYAWSLDGIKLLSDEYRQILNEVGGDVARANAVFTAVHPDKVVYDASGDLKANFYAGTGSAETRSKGTTPGAYLPSTESTLKWLDRNVQFVNDYKSVAAYFLPTQAANEPFSDAAYKAQIEFGLRERKSPAEFMQNIYVKHAESVFFPADKHLNNLIDQARLNGDQATVNSLTQQRHDWLQKFKDLNPFFGDKLDDYGKARIQARDQLSDLRKMVEKNAVPDGLHGKLSTLIKAYDNYQQVLNDHQGQTTVNVAVKAHALTTFNQWATEQLAGTPLESVFNGVFRVLNTNFDKINGS